MRPGDPDIDPQLHRDIVDGEEEARIERAEQLAEMRADLGDEHRDDAAKRPRV